MQLREYNKQTHLCLQYSSKFINIIRKKLYLLQGNNRLSIIVSSFSIFIITHYICLLNNKQKMLAELIFLPKPTSMRASSRVSWHYRSVESMTKSSTRVSCLADSCCQHEKQPDNTKRHRLPRSPISRSRSQHEEQTRPDKLLLIIGTWNYGSFRDSSCSG